VVVFLPLGLDGTGSATIPLGIPPYTPLCGLKLYFQIMLAGDPGATGSQKTAQTNGLEWILGSG
jgi:hypothetical protein